MFCFTRSILAAGFLSSAVCSSAPAAASMPGTEADVVTLPKYDITADRVLPPIEKWHYISIPGFEILSNASVRNTRLFVEDFYLLRQVAQIILPDLKEKTSAPTYIVLCGRGNAFDAFLPDRKLSMPASLFLGDAERAAIVVNFTFEDLDGEFQSILDTGANDPFRSFYVQYFRQLLRNSIEPAPPRWLEEGLVQVFASVEFSRRSIVIGKVGGEDGSGISAASREQSRFGSNVVTPFSSGNAEFQGSRVPGGGRRFGAVPPPAGKPGSFNSRLARRALLPLGRLLSFDPATAKNEDVVTFQYESYLFTHMCLYGRNQRFARPLLKFLDTVGQGAPATEDVFKSCFDKTYKQMETEMRGYISFTDYRATEFRFKNGSELGRAPEITLRDATDAESSRIAGEVLKLAGHKDEAINRLIAPYVRGNYDANLLAALGLAELSMGNTSRGQRFLEAAVKGDTSRPPAYVELAQLRFKESEQKAGREARDLSAQEITEVQNLLYRGLKHPPVPAAAYDLLARTWYFSPTPPTKAQFEEMAAAAEVHWKKLGLVFRVAALGLKYGYVDVSRRFIAFGLDYAQDEPTRSRFESLARQLPPEARGPAEGQSKAGAAVSPPAAQ